MAVTLDTIWSQNDQRWGGDKLGTCEDTIGSSGCFVTCDAMAISDYMPPGHYVTPAQVNNWNKDNNNYVNDCELTDEGVKGPAQGLAGLTLSVSALHYENEPCDLTQLKGSSDYQTFIRISNPGVADSHFMRIAAAWDGANPGVPDANSIIVDDPWDGVRKPFAESFGGNDPAKTIVKILRVWNVVSAPDPTAPAPTPVPAPAPSLDPAPTPSPTSDPLQNLQTAVDELNKRVDALVKTLNSVR